MGPLRWKLLPAFLLGLVWMSLRDPLGLVVADERTPDDAAPAEPAAVSLTDLCEDPTGWLGRRVRFTVQFRALEERWNPGLTRFGAGDWLGFSGWPDERFPWEVGVFESPMTRLFARRDSAASVLLSTARPYERFELVATVREVFFDEPWIEVEAAQPLFELIGEGTILHVGRAFEFARQAQWELALEQFRRATAAPLPAHARRELDAKIAECTRRRDAGVRARD